MQQSLPLPASALLSPLAHERMQLHNTTPLRLHAHAVPIPWHSSPSPLPASGAALSSTLARWAGCAGLGRLSLPLPASAPPCSISSCQPHNRSPMYLYSSQLANALALFSIAFADFLGSSEQHLGLAGLGWAGAVVISTASLSAALFPLAHGNCTAQHLCTLATPNAAVHQHAGHFIASSCSSPHMPPLEPHTSGLGQCSCHHPRQPLATPPSVWLTDSKSCIAL